MQAEIIAIGDELTTGQRLDTNSQWLSQQLGELGVRVIFHTTVGDEQSEMVDAFRTAVGRVGLVVVTGGLGPTADDLTRQALAAAAGVDLILDDASLLHVRQRFAIRGRAMPLSNEIQAHFPTGSLILPNPHGTAPGIDLHWPQIDNLDRPATRFFALPGVPAEMREMWHASVAPAILSMPSYEPRVIAHRQIKCFGVGESQLEQMVPELFERGRSPSVGITVHRGTITLRITSSADSLDAAHTAMEPTVDSIYQRLETLVFGEGDNDIQHAVAQLLSARRLSIAVAEWGTGGRIAHWLSDTPEGTEVLAGSIQIADLTDLDRISPLSSVTDKSGTPDKTSPGSPMAQRMAQAVRDLFQADIGLALAIDSESQERDSPEEPASLGHAHTALAMEEVLIDDRYDLGAHPDIVVSLTAKRTLNLLRRHLLKT